MVGLALIAFLPLLSSIAFGYSGHDLPFHLGTWLDLRANWQAHSVFPSWAPLANFSLGDARFLFYPPVSYLVAGLLSLVLPMKLVVGAYIWLSLFVAGICSYVASAEFVAESDRFTVAVIYMLSPYLLVTAMVRFAAAELLVQAWLPLVILCFVRSQSRNDTRAAWRAALLMGLLLGLSWLTNLPASIVMVYTFGIASVWVAWQARSFGALLRYGVAQGIGIGISAVHLVPAFLDKKRISSAQILAYDFRRNFMILPQPFHPFLGFCVLAAWLGVALVIVALRTEQVRRTPPLELLAVIGVLAFVFEVPVSYPLWRYLPMLPFVQFPFRFLSLTGLVTAILVAGVGRWRHFRKLAYGVAIAVALFVGVGQQLLNFALHRSPAPFAGVWQGMSKGYAGVPEYVPARVQTRQIPARLSDAPSASVDSSSACSVQVVAWQPAERIIETNGVGACRVHLATFAFPYWHAQADGVAPLVSSADQEGRIVLDVPAGHHRIAVTFDAETPLRMKSRALSCVIVLAAAVALFALRERRELAS